MICLLDSILLVNLLKGSLLPLFLYSPFLKLDYFTALTSEPQLTFEILALALIVALTWHWYQKKGDVILK